MKRCLTFAGLTGNARKILSSRERGTQYPQESGDLDVSPIVGAASRLFARLSPVFVSVEMAATRDPVMVRSGDTSCARRLYIDRWADEKSRHQCAFEI